MIAHGKNKKNLCDVSPKIRIHAIVIKVTYNLSLLIKPWANKIPITIGKNDNQIYPKIPVSISLRAKRYL